MNIWGIPDWLENEVRARDKKCVYCGIEMFQKMPRGSPRKAAATWEHIINDARIIGRENICLCCRSCNSSKGVKLLETWIESAYCKRRNISRETVADVVKEALAASVRLALTQ